MRGGRAEAGSAFGARTPAVVVWGPAVLALPRSPEVPPASLTQSIAGDFPHKPVVNTIERVASVELHDAGLNSSTLQRIGSSATSTLAPFQHAYLFTFWGELCRWLSTCI